jgi:cysteinyl-tRNA synthetase
MTSASGVHRYSRSGDVEHEADVDEVAVERLLASRGQAKLRGRFDEADSLRQQLLDQHRVRYYFELLGQPPGMQ